MSRIYGFILGIKNNKSKNRFELAINDGYRNNSVLTYEYDNFAESKEQALKELVRTIIKEKYSCGLYTYPNAYATALAATTFEFMKENGAKTDILDSETMFNNFYGLFANKISEYKACATKELAQKTYIVLKNEYYGARILCGARNKIRNNDTGFIFKVNLLDASSLYSVLGNKIAEKDQNTPTYETVEKASYYYKSKINKYNRVAAYAIATALLADEQDKTSEIIVLTEK